MRTASGYFLLAGCIFLGTVVYSARVVSQYFEAPDDLVVEGPSRVTVDHPSRSEPLERHFILYNPSARTARIKRVLTGCTCTTAGLAEGAVVPPGGRLRLRAKVSRFDAFKASFAEPIWVETETTRLHLWLTGTLPQRVLVRPSALYLQADAGGGFSDRHVYLRIPTRCDRGLTPGDLRLSGCEGARLTVSRVPRTSDNDYLDYSVDLRLPPTRDPAGLEGHLSVETGCGTVEIPIRVVGPSHAEGAG